MEEIRERKIDMSTWPEEERNLMTSNVKMKCLEFFQEAEKKSSELLKIYGIEFNIAILVRQEDVPAGAIPIEEPKKKKGRPAKVKSSV